MTPYARTDTSKLSAWWLTVDRWSLAAVVALVFAGAVLTVAASPAVAERIGVDQYHFVRRQMVFLPVALGLVIAVSLLDDRSVRRLAAMMLIGGLVLMAMTLLVGAEIKGATRWVRIGGFSLQPSEFVKPGFAVIVAWLFAEQRRDERFPGRTLACAIFVLTIGLLALQPDVGMAAVVSAIWAVAFFLAGMRLAVVMGLAGAFVGAAIAAYHFFDHVQSRVKAFLDPEVGMGYQVERALDAFRHGGLFGRGPGEGRVKTVLPDAHADFIFAVAGEEFGLIVCLVIVAVFLFITLRGFARAFSGDDLFRLIAAAGLLTQFALQSIINMASTVNLIPPKGMTLPFISYGGSSTIALALGVGMLLSLTRKRPALSGTLGARA